MHYVSSIFLNCRMKMSFLVYSVLNGRENFVLDGSVPITSYDYGINLGFVIF